MSTIIIIVCKLWSHDWPHRFHQEEHGDVRGSVWPLTSQSRLFWDVWQPNQSDQPNQSLRLLLRIWSHFKKKIKGEALKSVTLVAMTTASEGRGANRKWSEDGFLPGGPPELVQRRSDFCRAGISIMRTRPSWRPCWRRRGAQAGPQPSIAIRWKRASASADPVRAPASPLTLADPGRKWTEAAPPWATSWTSEAETRRTAGQSWLADGANANAAPLLLL